MLAFQVTGVTTLMFYPRKETSMSSTLPSETPFPDLLPSETRRHVTASSSLTSSKLGANEGRERELKKEKGGGKRKMGVLAWGCTHPLRARWRSWRACFAQKQRRRCRSHPYRNPRSLPKPGPNPQSLQTVRHTHSHSPTALDTHQAGPEGRRRSEGAGHKDGGRDAANWGRGLIKKNTGDSRA